jgi:hypothetical protein
VSPGRTNGVLQPVTLFLDDLAAKHLQRLLHKGVLQGDGSARFRRRIVLSAAAVYRSISRREGVLALPLSAPLPFVLGAGLRAVRKSSVGSGGAS